MTRTSALVASLLAASALAGGVRVRKDAAANRATLYVEGMFDNSYDNKTMLADAREVAASGFQVAILAFLHYHPGNCPDGAVYNGVCFSAAGVLPQVMRILRGPGSSIQQILVSIGGAGCQGDFDYVGSTWPQFSTDFSALATLFGFDGFDIDLEVGLGSYMDTLIKMVNYGASRNFTVTACPAVGLTSQSDWVSLVKATATARADGSPGISYLLLQTYGGGEAHYVQSYSQALQGIVPNTADYVFPGGEVSGGWGPSEAADMVHNSQKVSPGLGGAMLWDYRSVKLGFNPSHTNITEWGAAIVGALNGNAAASGAKEAATLLDDAAIARVEARARARYAERAARNAQVCMQPGAAAAASTA